MLDRHLPLEWLTRRHDGESVALIAWRDDVAPDLVRRATDAFGPFPRATRHLGRTQMLAQVANERTRRWVAARRRGQPVKQIAADEGVTRTLVSRTTSEWGPFPSDDVVDEWVEARRSGRTADSIATEYRAPRGLVLAATRASGPYPRHGPGLPDGLIGIKGIARRVRMSDPTVQRWAHTGVLPPPDFVTARGRKVWQEATIEAWMARAKFRQCPDCGALAFNLGQHCVLAHRTARSAGPDAPS